MSTRRNYIEEADAPTASAAQISLAEELIDTYVGPQDKHIKQTIEGQVSTHLSDGSTHTITDTSSNSQLELDDDYFKLLVLEILSGDSAGEIRYISASDRSARSITYSGTLLTLSSGDVFKLYQLGKFPRRKDVIHRTVDGENKYFKSIPIAVKDAVIAQAEYIVEQGDDFFTGDNTDKDSESIGNYSYSRGGSGAQSSTVKMTAPKARTLLRGIMNRKGRMEV